MSACVSVFGFLFSARNTYTSIVCIALIHTYKYNHCATTAATIKVYVKLLCVASEHPYLRCDSKLKLNLTYSVCESADEYRLRRRGSGLQAEGGGGGGVVYRKKQCVRKSNGN